MNAKFKFIAPLSLLILASFSASTHSQTVSEHTSTLRLTDIFQLPASSRGLTFTDQALAAQGHSVRLVGYMVQQERPTPGRFLLSPRPVTMSEHADGEADDLPASTVAVYLAPSQQDWLVPHAQGLIDVTGQLQLGRTEAHDHRVFWVSLQLPESAVVLSKATPEPNSHAH